MKKIMKFPVWLCCVAALCACSSGGDEQPELVVEPEAPVPAPEVEKLPIHISTVFKRVTDYAFEAGDRIGIYVVNHAADGSSLPLLEQGNHVDNMGFTYDGTWDPDTQIYWLDETTHADFYLLHPYTPSITDVHAIPFSVSADQSSEKAYKSSDLLLGSATDVAPTETAVSITAHHALSQMQISVVAGNGFTEESLAASDVSVKINGIRTEASVDLSTATVTASGTAASVTPLKTDNGYKALVVPQTVAEGNLVTVNVDGRDFNLKKAFTFEGGKIHRFSVVLNKTSNGINVTIGQWEDDGIDHGGTAE